MNPIVSYLQLEHSIFHLSSAKNFVGQVRRRNSEESRGKKSEKSKEDKPEGENQSKTTRTAGGGGTRVEVAGRAGRMQQR